MTVRKSLAWSFSQQAGQNLLQFIGSIVIARLLTPDEIGVFALAMATNYLISSLRDFGVGTYIIREEHLTDEKIRTAYGIWIAISWTLGLLVLMSRNWIAGIYNEPGIASVLALLSVVFFLVPFGAPAYSLLTREMRFDVLHHIALASAFTGTATSISLAFIGWSYISLAWGLIAGSIVRLALLLYVRPDHLRLLPSLAHWRDILHFGGYVTGASLIGTAGVEAPKFILGAYVNPAAVALFERAVQLPSVLRQGLFAPLGRVLLPSFSQDIRNDQSIGPAVEKLVAITTAIVWPAFLTLGLISVPVVVFLFGENWRVAGAILPYLLLSQALLALIPQPDQILLPHGKARRLFGARVFSFITAVILAVIGSLHSLEMFAMLRVVQALLALAIYYLAIRRFWQTNLPRVAKTYLKSALIAAISSLPAFLVFIDFRDTLSHTALLGVMIVSPCFWFVTLLATRHPLASELRKLLIQGKEKAKDFLNKS